MLLIDDMMGGCVTGCLTKIKPSLLALDVMKCTCMHQKALSNHKYLSFIILDLCLTYTFIYEIQKTCLDKERLGTDMYRTTMLKIRRKGLLAKAYCTVLVLGLHDPPAIQIWKNGNLSDLCC